MISVQQCKIHADECVKLSNEPDISMLVATLLMSMARCWVSLGSKVKRYNALVKSDG